MKSYYTNPNVRARMIEYLGGDSFERATCEYLTAGDEGGSNHRQPLPVAELPSLWDHDLDISRSLWDGNSLLLHLDIEYVNFDSPAVPYVRPRRVTDLQRHVEWIVDAVLLDCGIAPLHLLIGRGHHYVWRIEQQSSAFESLAGLGAMPKSLEQFYERGHRPNNRTIPLTLGNASLGLGLVVEYLAHRIKELAAPMCEIPVELTAVEVGPSHHGREMISIDVSEYGDPLSSRVVRVPFSFYLKPRQQSALIGNKIVEKLPPIFLIPLDGIDSSQGATVMRDVNQVLELAARTSVRIPEQSQGTEALIGAYLDSSVARFHRWFYSAEQHPAEAWPKRYDSLSMDNLPPCARYILEHPNDLLLKPAGVERVVRVLLSLGWHPRHISGIIRSKFERPYQWGTQWTATSRRCELIFIRASSRGSLS